MTYRKPTTAVLVVEDDDALRELYRSNLVMAGYAVVAVDDGVEALQRIDAHSPVPDAVVLDLGLPRLPGRDVQKELAAQADTRHIPIIVVTGSDTGNLNPDDFACILTKPVSADALVDAVEACLRNHSRRQ